MPLDSELKLGQGHASPALKRVVSLAGITGSFYKAPELLKEIGEIKVNARQSILCWHIIQEGSGQAHITAWSREIQEAQSGEGTLEIHCAQQGQDALP